MSDEVDRLLAEARVAHMLRNVPQVNALNSPLERMKETIKVAETMRQAKIDGFMDGFCFAALIGLVAAAFALVALASVK